MKKTYETKRVQTLVFIALITALITSVTIFTSIPFGNGGYFNLGDSVIAVLATFTPIRYVMVAASLGSALADLLTGYVYYSVFTALIKAGEALVVYFLRDLLKTKFYPLVFVVSASVMLLGYGLVDQFLLGNYAFFASISVNAIQGLTAVVIPTIAYPFIKRLNLNVKGLIS